MRALVAPKYTKPSGYEVIDLPVPSVQKPNEMLIKVHAAGIMTGDTLVAGGTMKLLFKAPFPIRIGIECSGVVINVGSAVKNFKPGDAVYGAAFGHPMEFENAPGYCSEYCIGRESLFVHKPAHLSFEEAASLGGFTLTAYQSFELGAKHLADRGKTLEGSTVFVPGALSATGALGIQVLKNVYGVGKIIATVSTSKVPLVEKYLPGMVDQVVDYTKFEDLSRIIPSGSIDFAYNTQWSSLESIIPLMNKENGVIVSIASLFPPKILRQAMGPMLPFWAAWVAALAQLYYRWLLRGTNIKLDFLSGNLGKRDDVEKTAEIIALGKVKSVMRVVKLEDIEAVRKACDEVYRGKGGLGRLIVKIV
ncbi:hypothetical protein JX266_009082 [Neoarthrinium moseri]|nr:hypothetical protein JX266_009082 [Neoarthrinium moseri]